MLGATVLDDGTLDTVIECYCPECGARWEERFSADAASVYRDDFGWLDLDGTQELLDGFNVYCENCEN